MAFSVVEGEGRTLWCATDGSSTYYIGQIVSIVATTKAMTNGTVVPLDTPHGSADTTHFEIPFGVVVGINNRTPTYGTLGSKKVEYATGVVSSANQIIRDFTGAEGMYGKGDPQLLVQIAEITPNTIIRGPFCMSAYGTGLTLQTATSASAGGGIVAFAANSSGVVAAGGTPVTLMRTMYCRSGANRGIYRVLVDVSATAPAVTTAFPYGVAIGDTFVTVPAKQGLSYILITSGMFIDAALGQDSNGTNGTFHVIVYRLNLEADAEWCDFRFLNMHFDNARA